MENKLLFAGVKQKNQLYHFKILNMGDQSPELVDYTAWETGKTFNFHFFQFSKKHQKEKGLSNPDNEFIIIISRHKNNILP